MNCAIIIGVGLIAFSLALIIADVVLTAKDKKREKAEKDANGNTCGGG